MNNRDDRDSRWQGQRGDPRGQQQPGNDDRGFVDRAGDEVRSWFGDDEASRRREQDERSWEREQRMSGNRDNQPGSDSHAGYRGTSGGYGNQSGDSWNQERPGRAGSYGAYGAGDRGRQGEGYAPGSSGGGDTWGGVGQSGGGASGFGGYADNGRRFDRVDSGSTGTQGAHPMSAPTGGGYGGGYGIGASGSSGSSASRYAAAGATPGGGRGRDVHDPHYSEWRDRQIQSLDSDYDEYRREHQSKFEQDFGNWRSKRGEQRQTMNKAKEDMEVVGSDGEHIGTVDKIRGDRIVLTKKDENAGGIHHSIPCSWIENVDDKVTVNKTAAEAMQQWRDEERNRALFEREDSGSDGPHILNRSFSGTY
ncbi:MAG: DUF2171 domain-containing protein [Pseudomonadota bacterium]|nr:DUF2171 domain-containing protein [Pseudomonadota bacterium]